MKHVTITILFGGLLAFLAAFAQEETLDGFSITDCYRDTTIGGRVTVFQGAGPGAISCLKNGEAILKMEIVDEAGKPCLSLAPDTIQQDCVLFTFDADTLPIGKYGLRGTYMNPITGKNLASQGSFLKVAKLPEYRTYVDEHRRLIVDGKPFFPLGMYFYDVTRENLRPYLDSKFNCLLPYIAPDAEMLDYLQENHLKLLFSIKDNISSESDDDAETKKLQAAGLANVERLKDHPAIIAWYINDELREKHVDDAIQYYRKCVELDPSRPTYTVLWHPGEMRTFLQATDIIGNDPYPIPESIPAKAIGWTRRANDAVMGARMIIQVPQTFCWGRYWLIYNRDPKEYIECRRPTYQEMDAMAWMCIAGGANGLIFYSYFDMLERAQATDKLPAIPFDEHFDECRRIAERIMAHEQVLLSAGIPLGYTVAGNGGGKVVCRAYELDGITWLLVVNTSHTDRLPLRLEMERPVALHGLSLGTPTVIVNGSEVSVSLAPLESAFIQLK